MIRTKMPASRGGRILVWLFFATFVVVGFGWFGGGNELPKALSLQATGLHVPGVLTSMKPGSYFNNPTSYYDFEVGGRKLHGYSRITERDTHGLGPGSAVTITYLPRNPNDNCVDLTALKFSINQAMFTTVTLEFFLGRFFIPWISTGKGPQ